MTTRLLSMFMAFAVFATAGCGAMPTAKSPLSRAARGMAAKGSVGGENGAPWTVLVYMAADSNLSESVPSDLIEMEHGIEGDGARILAFVDQDQKGDSRIYDIKPAKDPDDWKHVTSKTVSDGGAVIPAGGEADSGSPATLERFIRWGTKRYPSQRTMLVVWNHGTPAFMYPGDGLKSMCSDKDAGTHFTLSQLAEVGRRVGDVQRPDIVALDMCLLGHVEAAYELAPLADFMIASERVEPGWGLNYFSLAAAASGGRDVDPRQLVEYVVSGYKQDYQHASDMATMSGVDLAALRSGLVPALDRFATNLRGAIADPKVYGPLKAALDQAYAMSAQEAQEKHAVDLGLALRVISTAWQLPKPLREEAAAVRKAYDAAIVANATILVSPEVYTGLKIYYHPDGYKPIYGDGTRQTFGTTAWNQFLIALHSR